MGEPAVSPEVLVKCRVELAGRGITGSLQPYHTAAPMELPDAESYIRKCSDSSAALARTAVRDVTARLHDCHVEGACILLASGRPLPPLPAVLASHALIHAAEGEFYRSVLRQACEHCGLAVTGVREKDIAAEVARALNRPDQDLALALAQMGKSAGPPWQQDQKLAALGAWLVLARGR